MSGVLSMVITCEDIILFWKLTYCIFNTVMSANEQVMSIKLRIDEWDSGQRRGLWGGERNILETDGSRGQGNTRRRKGDCRRRSKRARWVRLLRGVGEKNGNWRRHRNIYWRLQKWECYDVCAELRSRKRLRHEIIRWTTKVGELDRMVGQSDWWYQREGTVGQWSARPCYMQAHVSVHRPHIQVGIIWRRIRRILYVIMH